MKTEVRGKVVYDQDSKRYHRYQITGSDMVGTLYLKKGLDVSTSYRLILEPITEEEDK